MHRAVQPLSRLLPLALLAAGLLVPVTSGRAQNKGGPREEDAKVVLPQGGHEKLERFLNQRETREAWTALTKGERTPSDATKDLVRSAAQFYVYRVTWTWKHDDPGYMGNLYTQLDLALAAITNNKVANQSLMPVFCKELTACLKDVLPNDRLIARINAARMLARVAATEYEPVGDLLAEVLNDPKQHDAVKFWALKGMANFFARTRGDNPLRIKDEAREQRCLLALNAFTTRKSPLPDKSAADEVAALRYVRRAAVHALGETRWPAAVVDKKLSPEGATALVLLRILRKDGVTPVPDLSEQVEAAVALCQLVPGLLDKEYQPDYVAAELGRFVAEFAQHFYEARDEKIQPHPWRLYRERLLAALDELKFNTRLLPSKAYVDNVVAQIRPVVEAVEGKAARAPESARLNGWLTSNAPKSQSVYKSLPDSFIKVMTAPAQ